MTSQCFTENHVDDIHVYEPESFLLIGKTSIFAHKSEKNNMYLTKDNSNCNCLSFLWYLCIAIGLNHTAAMLSPEGLKTFVFAHRNSFPNISTRGSGTKSYVYGQYGSHSNKAHYRPPAGSVG